MFFSAFLTSVRSLGRCSIIIIIYAYLNGVRPLHRSEPAKRLRTVREKAFSARFFFARPGLESPWRDFERARTFSTTVIGNQAERVTVDNKQVELWNKNEAKTFKSVANQELLSWIWWRRSCGRPSAGKCKKKTEVNCC